MNPKTSVSTSSGPARSPRRAVALTLAGLVAATALTGCLGGTDGGRSEVFRQAGSSTVLPVAQVWAEEFGLQHRGVQFVVGGGGSGAGFQQFCRGELDVADGSRAIKPSERDACMAAGIVPVEFQVAIDGLAVTVSTDNTFVDHLTVEELNRIWTADPSKQANTWRDLRPDWPDDRIELYGPGTNSGTFDYFVEVIIHPFDGTESKGRSDYTPSEDDHVLVQGVRSSPTALAYFGLAYAVENEATVRIVPIDEGKGQGPMLPTNANVATGKYTPLARPLFMYTDGPPTGTLLDYFEFGLSEEGQALVEDVGYIALPAGIRIEMLSRLRGG